MHQYTKTRTPEVNDLVVTGWVPSKKKYHYAYVISDVMFHDSVVQAHPASFNERLGWVIDRSLNLFHSPSNLTLVWRNHPKKGIEE